jgi:hypothetical protein
MKFLIMLYFFTILFFPRSQIYSIIANLILNWGRPARRRILFARMTDKHLNFPTFRGFNAKIISNSMGYGLS